MSLSETADAGLKVIGRDGNIKEMRLSYPEIIEYFKRRNIDVAKISRATESGIDYYYDIPITGNRDGTDINKIVETISFLLGSYKPGSRIKKLIIRRAPDGINLKVGWGD